MTHTNHGFQLPRVKLVHDIGDNGSSWVGVQRAAITALSPGAFQLYAFMLSRFDESYFSQRSAARELGRSQVAIQRAMEELESAGVVMVDRGVPQAPVYTANRDFEGATAAAEEAQNDGAEAREGGELPEGGALKSSAGVHYKSVQGCTKKQCGGALKNSALYYNITTLSNYNKTTNPPNPPASGGLRAQGALCACEHDGHASETDERAIPASEPSPVVAELTALPGGAETEQEPTPVEDGAAPVVDAEVVEDSSGLNSAPHENTGFNGLSTTPLDKSPASPSTAGKTGNGAVLDLFGNATATPARKETGKKKKTARKYRRAERPDYSPEFAEYWAHVSRKEGKADAARLFEEAVEEVGAEQVIRRAREYYDLKALEGTERRYVKSGKNWLRDRLYEDDRSDELKAAALRRAGAPGSSMQGLVPSPERVAEAEVFERMGARRVAGGFAEIDAEFHN